MISNRQNISTITSLQLALFLFFMCTGNLFSQDQMSLSEQDIPLLKERFNKTTIDNERAQFALNLSTAYQLIYENDSSEIYASEALKLIPESPNKEQLKIRAKAIENLGIAYSYSNTKIAIDTLQVALKYWKETDDKQGIAEAYLALGQAYSIKGDKILSLKAYHESLELFEQTNNKAYMADTWYLISLEKRYLGNYGEALENTIKSLEIAREINDTLLITNALLGNSFNYLYSKKFTEALQEQEKALKLYEVTKDSAGIARAHNDMGVTQMYADSLTDALTNHRIALSIRKQLKDNHGTGSSYNYLATILKQQGKLKEALVNIEACISYSIKAGDLRFIADAYFEAGDIHIELKDYDKALASYNSALDIAKNNNASSLHAEALMNIGKTQRIMGNIVKSIESLERANQFVTSNDYTIKRDIYEQIVESYKSKNDYKNAFETQLKYQQMHDSVIFTERADKIATLTQKLIFENQVELQKASQEKQLAVQESQITKQKFIRNLSIGGLVVALMIALALFQRFKEKRKLNLALEKSLRDLKSTQKQLVHSEKMASLGELTAGIAHEIQNPLNFVNNFSEVSAELIDEMHEEIDSKNYEEAVLIANDLKDNLTKITHHGQRADSIVKGMLHHSRNSSGTKELTDINKLTDEYLRLAYHGLRAKDKSFNATFKSEYDDRIGKLSITAQEIGRVILNLFTNAFYAVSEKQQENSEKYNPTVSVKTIQVKDKIMIEVNDNGNGIPEAVLNNIFKPFFTTKPSGKGTGLGLSMSHDIIKAHGGDLRVETIEGQGSKFIIEIPKET